MDYIKSTIKGFFKQKWYEKAFIISTFVLFALYGYTYFLAKQSNKEKQYIPLIITARTLFLASFLIFFYNPLRSSFEYGHALPLFTFSAGITLLFFLDKYDILNLAHFMLYGETLPPNPKKICRLVNDPTINTFEEQNPSKHHEEI
jgi:uncharacterized membrane protein